MKAQGLPLNFIILGALALLVLVVAVAFFMTGTATMTTTMTQSQVQQACQTLCNQITRDIQGNYSLTASMCRDDAGDPSACFGRAGLEGGSAWNYVNRQYNVPGVGEGVTCLEIISCETMFRDATNCMIRAEDPEADVKEPTC